jgi:hypothetical protein
MQRNFAVGLRSLRRHSSRGAMSVTPTPPTQHFSSPLSDQTNVGDLQQSSLSLNPYNSQKLFYTTSRSILDDSKAGDGGSGVVITKTSTGETKKKRKGKKHNFVPKKAAVTMTKQAREFFRKLVAMKPEKAGIILNYDQSKTGEPRMVFSFDFVSKEQLHPRDEGYVILLSCRE